jgi:O-antigen/teichoic acid export membrane protein
MISPDHRGGTEDRSATTRLVGWIRHLWPRLQNSPVGMRLAHGAFWSLIGLVASRALALPASILVARALGSHGFGSFGVIQNTIGMFGILAGFGLGLTCTKYVAEFRLKDPGLAGRILAVSSLTAALLGGAATIGLWLMAPRLAAGPLANPELVGPLRISAILLLLGAHNGQQNGALTGLEAFRTMTRINVVTGVLTIPLMAGGAWLGGITGGVWGLVAVQFATWTMTKLTLAGELKRVGLRFVWHGCWQERSILWKFSLPAFLAGAVVVPANWLCMTFLVSTTGGYAQIGIFNAANQWFTLLMFIPQVIGQSSLPILAERLNAKDYRQTNTILRASMVANAAILLPLAVLGALASPWLLDLYGQEFGGGQLTLVLCLVTAVLLGVQFPVGQILIAADRLWLGLIMNLGWAGIFIGGSWLLADGGALGLASSRLIAYVFHAVWTFAYAWIFMRR